MSYSPRSAAQGERKRGKSRPVPHNEEQDWRGSPAKLILRKEKNKGRLHNRDVRSRVVFVAFGHETELSQIALYPVLAGDYTL